MQGGGFSDQHDSCRSQSVRLECPKQRQDCVTYHMGPYAYFLLNPKNSRVYHDSYSYLLVQQQNDCLKVARERSNPTLWNRVLELQRQRRSRNDERQQVRSHAFWNFSDNVAVVMMSGSRIEVKLFCPDQGRRIMTSERSSLHLRVRRESGQVTWLSFQHPRQCTLHPEIAYSLGVFCSQFGRTRTRGQRPEGKCY